MFPCYRPPTKRCWGDVNATATKTYRIAVATRLMRVFDTCLVLEAMLVWQASESKRWQKLSTSLHRLPGEPELPSRQMHSYRARLHLRVSCRRQWEHDCNSLNIYHNRTCLSMHLCIMARFMYWLCQKPSQYSLYIWPGYNDNLSNATLTVIIMMKMTEYLYLQTTSWAHSERPSR